MRISKKTEYGLRAMVFLAKNKGKIVPLKMISKKEGISFDFLEKIFSQLEKKNLVGAKKGVFGGYFLKKPSQKIKLGQIVNVLEKETALVRCVSGKNYLCPKAKKCPTKNFWKKIQRSLNLSLNSLSLKDLIK